MSAADRRSDRGVALIIVLLMMAVLSGLVTGFAMNGQTEVAMAENEVYFAGARAAAEAGLNRATERIINDTTSNLLAGADQAFSATEADAVNADNGGIGFLLNDVDGPYPLDAAGRYSYNIDILDDDDPQLYPAALTAAQLAAMGENGNRFVNTNQRLILRATGFGPKNTTIRIMRELQSVDNLAQTNTTSLANPAILVNGDLTINGNPSVRGLEGNVHANQNLTISGNASNIEGDATATGTFTANHNWKSGGTFGGGYDAINVPDIQAANYLSLADFTLHSDGSKTDRNGNPCGSPCASWSLINGQWSLSGNLPSSPTGTFYVKGSASISGNLGSIKSPLALSIIAEGSITIAGNAKLRPENADKIQLVADGDVVITGNADLDDDATQTEGQILVREQLNISGNMEFQGRIMVQNSPTVFSQATSNSISGNPRFTYNGTLDAIATELGGGATTYTNNVRGWIEQ
jgi:cytoskeletal protein CcmA (bactofilin family)